MDVSSNGLQDWYKQFNITSAIGPIYPQLYNPSLTWNTITSASSTNWGTSWNTYIEPEFYVTLSKLKEIFESIKKNGNKQILFYLNDEDQVTRKIAKLFLDFIDIEKDSKQNETSS